MSALMWLAFGTGYGGVGLAAGRFVAGEVLEHRHAVVKELKEDIERTDRVSYYAWTAGKYAEFKLPGYKRRTKTVVGLSFWLGTLAWPVVALVLLVTVLVRGVVRGTTLLMPKGVEDWPLTRRELEQLEVDAGIHEPGCQAPGVEHRAPCTVDPVRLRAVEVWRESGGDDV